MLSPFAVAAVATTS